jgi:hypothetical protein
MDRIPITTGTYTETPIPTGGTESLTPSLTPFPMASNTEEAWPTPWPDGFTPTTRPTPTQGLPSTKTPAPAEVCPAPTHADVTIQFSNNPLEYGSQILRYLRANGNLSGAISALKAMGRERFDEFDADQVFLAEEDVTGDGAAEFVFVMNQLREPEKDPNPYLSSHETVIFILGCRLNDYVILYEELSSSGHWWGSTNPNMEPRSPIAVGDVNGDGLPEILFMHTYSMDYHSLILTSLLAWDGDGFRSLIVNADLSVDFPVLQDIDENGTVEVLLPQDHMGIRYYCDEGPVRISYDIFMWDGEYYRYMWSDPGIPTYRFQAAFDGDYYVKVGLYDRAEAMYGKAISSSELKTFDYEEWSGGSIFCPYESEPNERPYILAYSRLRLLELHVFMKKAAEAEDDWRYLANHYPLSAPGYYYAWLADIFWKTYGSEDSIDAACSAVAEKAEQNRKELFGWMDIYGYRTTSPTPETICPFHSILSEQ